MKNILCCLCILFMAIDLPAQERQPSNLAKSDKPKMSPKDRFFFGGNIGLNFGSLTYINVSPIIGYRLTEKLGAGLGPTYSYYKDHRDKNYYYETSTYGGRLFAQYQVLENVLLYSEFETVNIEVPDLLFTSLVRRNVSSLFVGGGYAQRIGNGASFFSIMLLYNIMESDYVIYDNPVLRTGITIGI